MIVKYSKACLIAGLFDIDKYIKVVVVISVVVNYWLLNFDLKNY